MDVFPWLQERLGACACAGAHLRQSGLLVADFVLADGRQLLQRVAVVGQRSRQSRKLGPSCRRQTEKNHVCKSRRESGRRIFSPLVTDIWEKSSGATGSALEPQQWALTSVDVPAEGRRPLQGIDTRSSARSWSWWRFGEGDDVTQNPNRKSEHSLPDRLNWTPPVQTWISTYVPRVR